MAYVYAGYGITVATLASYALRVVARERRLRRR
jgi:heme exporter protein D